MSGWVFLDLFSNKQGLMCLAQRHNAVSPVRLEPATPLSQVKHLTTEPLSSPKDLYSVHAYGTPTAKSPFNIIIY